MKIERISENKLRVFLSLDDLVDRNIDLENFQYGNPETQAFFWDLMEQAEQELGFDVLESQLCVEAMSDMEHGFTFTITKLDSEGEFESIHKFIKNRYKKKELTLRKKTTALVSTVAIWSFSDFDTLTEVSRHLSSRITGTSCAWRCDNQYFLVLYGAESPKGGAANFEDILTEYGSRMLNTTLMEGYLNEYGTRLLPSNAIQTLAGLSNPTE